MSSKQNPKASSSTVIHTLPIILLYTEMHGNTKDGNTKDISDNA